MKIGTELIRREPLTHSSAGIILTTVLTAALSFWNADLMSCTAFYVKTGNGILVGNNEDGNNPDTRIWTIPGSAGTYGRLYFGFSDLSAQGGINEKGLWFDAFGLPFIAAGPVKGEIYPGDLQDKIMADCATVDDVISLLNKYNRSQMTRYQWMLGDRSGNCIIVEADTVIRMSGNYQVITNFRQSRFPSGKGYECNRYQIAGEMLAEHSETDLARMRKILQAVHSEGEDVTLYSYIADLSRGKVYVYHFHDFETPVILDVRKEISKGKQVYVLQDLFPRNHAAESFAYQARAKLKSAIESHRYKNFDNNTYNDYSGKYLVTHPALQARQSITISRGENCLDLQLNGGGAYHLIPDSPSSFVLLGYGGLEIGCRFSRNKDSVVNLLTMEGSGVSMEAKKTGE